MKLTSKVFKKLDTKEIVELFDRLMTKLAAAKGKQYVAPSGKRPDRLNFEQKLTNLLGEFEKDMVVAEMKSMKLKASLVQEVECGQCGTCPACKKTAKKMAKVTVAAIGLEEEDVYASAPPSVRVKRGLSPVPSKKAAAHADKAVPLVAVDKAEMEDFTKFAKLKLAENQFVVHEDYGKAKYRGTTRAHSMNVVMLEFRDKELLYVPYAQASKIQPLRTTRKSFKLSKLAKNAQKIISAAQVERQKKVKAEIERQGVRISPTAAKVLEGIRAIAGVEPEEEALPYTDSTSLAKHLNTSITVVCKMLYKLEEVGLIRLDDDSPDDKHKFYYARLTQEGIDLDLAASIKEVRLPGAAPGPNSKLAGKTIHILCKGNPRRPQSHGWHSFNVIKEGMTYEQYKAAGGRNSDLLWDADKGFVELRDGKGGASESSAPEEAPEAPTTKKASSKKKSAAPAKKKGGKKKK